MNKEQIIDEAYVNYGQKIISEDLWMLVAIGWPSTQEEFINKCKTDTEFSEKWGLKIEERELGFKERCDIQIKNLDGMYSSEKDIFIRSSIDEIKLIKMNENNIPTKLITITYKDTIIESYEN
jgi:hypothetical protein